MPKANKTCHDHPLQSACGGIAKPNGMRARRLACSPFTAFCRSGKKSLTFTTRAPNTLVSSLCLLRADAVVSFDGKHSEPLNRGQILRVAMSNNPLPTVNRVDDTADWFDGIASAFHFNERPMQRSLREPPSSQ